MLDKDTDANVQSLAEQPSQDANQPSSRGVSRREFLKIAAVTGATLGAGAGMGGLLAACGASDETATTAGPTTTAATAAPATTAAADTTTSVSAGPEQGRPIRIGLVSPETGALADFAVADRWWVEHAQKALPNGIVAGDAKAHQVEIVVRNSQSDSNRASQVAGDLVNNDKVDLIMVSGTADTANPVADQCEALEMPCISNFHPWQSYYFGRGATPDKPFKWTYAQALGMETSIAGLLDMWNQVPNNKVVGLLWSNNSDGMAWANEQTGMPPALEAAGYTQVQPTLYQPGSEDYTAQISAFKKAGCEIQMGVASPPDFTNFWKQCLQQGYRPKIAGTVKAINTPYVLDTMGPAGYGLFSEVSWHPTYPFKDSLTGMSCRELADEFEEVTGFQWSAMIGQYAKIEWAVDIFERVADIDSNKAILEALRTTKTETCYGPIDFTEPVKMGSQHPVENVYKPPHLAGQWRKGDKWPFDVFICSNVGGPMVPVQSQLEPMVYDNL